MLDLFLFDFGVVVGAAVVVLERVNGFCFLREREREKIKKNGVFILLLCKLKAGQDRMTPIQNK